MGQGLLVLVELEDCLLQWQPWWAGVFQVSAW